MRDRPSIALTSMYHSSPVVILYLHLDQKTESQCQMESTLHDILLTLMMTASYDLICSRY